MQESAEEMSELEAKRRARQLVKTLFDVAFLLGVYLSDARFAQTGEIEFYLDLIIFQR